MEVDDQGEGVEEMGKGDTTTVVGQRKTICKGEAAIEGRVCLFRELLCMYRYLWFETS